MGGCGGSITVVCSNTAEGDPHSLDWVGAETFHFTWWQSQPTLGSQGSRRIQVPSALVMFLITVSKRPERGNLREGRFILLQGFGGWSPSWQQAAAPWWWQFAAASSCLLTSEDQKAEGGGIGSGVSYGLQACPQPSTFSIENLISCLFHNLPKTVPPARD